VGEEDEVARANWRWRRSLMSGSRIEVERRMGDEVRRREGKRREGEWKRG
jgi:hypothetical protein